MVSAPETWGVRTSALEVSQHFSDELQGRTVLLTGPSKEGVGLATALALASQSPAPLILAGRTLEEAKAEIIKQYPETQIRLVQCDLSSMDSVRRPAEEINGEKESVDIVINNAAVMDTPYELTKDSHELQFASNYLGHWLLVNSIMPKILAGKNKRVVNVSSIGHHYGGINWEDPNWSQGGYTPNKGYGQAKTAMNLHSIGLTRRYADQGLTSFSLHPGGISSPLQKHWTLPMKMEMNKLYGKLYDDEGKAIMGPDSLWKTADQGASTSMRAALDSSIADQSGSYLDDCQIANERVAPYAKDKADAERLWTLTNDLLGMTF